MQRNLIASLIKDKYDSALVAFYEPNLDDWRFSHVKVEYEFNEKGIREKLSSPRRHSFLVGVNEPNHTCQKQFLDLLCNEDNIQLKDIEQAFTIENVTDEFFNKYNELFLDLVDSLESVKKDDKNVRNEFNLKNIKSSDFAKKLMGQIVFIYFLQKKGWLGVEKDAEWGTGSKNFIRNIYEDSIAKNENFFNDVLEPLFYEGLSEEVKDYHYSKFNYKVPFLNGGLFEPINNYDWVNTDLTLENSIFKEIFDTFDKFNFTVKEDEPLEKEIAVDPEMLGKVFENLLEVTDRKSKGAFYTPRYIVHSMCQETLIDYLNTNSNVSEEDLRVFITKGDLAVNSIIRVNEEKKKYNGKNFSKILLPNSIKEHSEELEYLLKKIKVVDPAVGSGAFPVGMMNEIVKARYILWLLNGIEDINVYDLKKETIENSLYGVDLELSATDVTKLRFWLSLIVDEDAINEVKPLPNLDNHIMCGNSVIDGYKNIKLFDDSLITRSEQTRLSMTPAERTFEKLELKKKEYFDISGPIRKEILKNEIKELKWEFIVNYLKDIGHEDLIDEIKQYEHAETKPFFIWELEFSEVFKGANPGFDIVIGNPPYVRHQRIVEFKKYLENYKVYNGRADLYVYFFEKGFNILKKGGHLSFICSNKFVKSDYGTPLRKLILNRSIVNYIDYTSENIFKGVAVDTSVITIKNDQMSLNHKIYIDNKYYLEQSRLDEQPWIIAKPEELNIKNKIESMGKPLNEIISGINKGLLTGYNKAFVIDEETKTKLIAEDPNSMDVIKPLIVGRDVKRFRIKYGNMYILYLPWEFDIEKYPAIKSHMLQFKDKLANRTEVKNGRINWWVLRRYAPNYYHEFEMPKIIYPEIGERLYATYSEEPYYMNNKCFMITEASVNLKYLSALLSSKVLDFFFRLSGYNLKNKGIVLLKMYIEKLPIPIISTEEQQEFIDIVDELLKINSQIEDNENLIDEFNYLDNKLEKMIYRLYGLSDEEEKIIEEYLN